MRARGAVATGRMPGPTGAASAAVPGWPGGTGRFAPRTVGAGSSMEKTPRRA
jgi:hypothetical protein